MTVVHRLSGWKLLSLLAASAPAALELDELPSAQDVHTNVVAGFLSDDNRTVVAHLPQAEVEAGGGVASPPLLPGFAAAAGPANSTGASEYTLVLNDGRRVPARFVGLDAATGLSLLEAAEPVSLAGVIGDAGHTEDPAVGQRVVLYAPVPVGAAPASRKAAEQKAAAAPRAPAVVGEAGYVYASITSAEGLLTEVARAPSGRAYAFTAQALKVNPAWTGAVATDATGSLVGIVSRSEAGLTQIVPADALRLAVERVKTTRASVPQPWLGARGDSAANAPLDFWVGKGWERGRAFSLIRDRGGVLLTSVAPGTPAALAGLRPGDLISRVAGREVRSAQDLSLVLKEQSIGSAVEFTVLRAPQAEPLKLPVLLSGTQNPALATAEAETRAARASLLAVGAELRLARQEQLRAAGSAFETPEALAR
ncbi:MAG TPA: PDZ domain-containing protein, partial [Pyrinomonadaceae bacterium]|nr:PDZ domain-containing protein [Pyrinomonadaceae bacterium]